MLSDALVLIPVRNEMVGSQIKTEVAPAEYQPNLDVLRLLSVAAIVWLHSGESETLKAGSIWCRFAVPAFVATSVLLLVWRHGGDSPINVNLEAHQATYWFSLSWEAFPSALMVFGILPFCKHGKLPRLSLSLALVSGWLLWLSIDGKYPNLLQNAAGVILVLSAVLAPCLIPVKSTIQKLGGLALPIYLLHPLIIHAIQAVGHRVAHQPVSMSFDGVVLFAGLGGSGFSAWYLQKIPRASWLVTIR